MYPLPTKDSLWLRQLSIQRKIVKIQYVHVPSKFFFCTVSIHLGNIQSCWHFTRSLSVIDPVHLGVDQILYPYIINTNSNVTSEWTEYKNRYLTSKETYKGVDYIHTSNIYYKSISVFTLRRNMSSLHSRLKGSKTGRIQTHRSDRKRSFHWSPLEVSRETWTGVPFPLSDHGLTPRHFWRTLWSTFHGLWSGPNMLLSMDNQHQDKKRKMSVNW